MLNNLKKRIINLKSNNRIILVGRGFTTNYFLKNYKKICKKGDILIGFNTKELSEKIDFLYTNKKIIDSKKVYCVHYKQILKELKKIKPIKIGTIDLAIYPLLYYINNHLSKNIKLFTWGFDFSTPHKLNDFFNKTFHKDYEQREINITGQKRAFFKIQEKFDKISFFNHGYNLFSDVNPKSKVVKKLKITNKVKIVAEVTTNHFGNNNLIKKFIRLSAKAGADYVKFQKRNVETFYTQRELNKRYQSPFGKTFGEYRKKLELNNGQINLIIDQCKKHNIKPLFSVLDIESFNIIKKYNFDYIKLPSTISKDKKFFNFVSKNLKKKKIIISSGMENEEYFDFIIKKFSKFKEVIILHCISSYPTFLNDINIGVIRYLSNISKKFRYVTPGFSSHDLIDEASMMAVSSGAKMIEKHVKFGQSGWAHFNDTAIDIETDFVEFVKKIRRAELIYGDEKKKILKSEHHKYTQRKS